MTETWIKLSRKILDWRWFTDANTFRVFIYLLLKANIEDKDFLADTIRRGEVATSIGNIAKTLGISYQNTRTALSHLKSTGELTITRKPKYLVISITNYDLYQQSNNQLTINQQSTNNQLTTTKEYKNIRNKEIEREIDKEKESRKRTSRFTPPDFEEVSAYCLERGNSVDPQTFIDFYSSKGWMVGKNPMKDWKAAVRTWEKSEITEKDYQREMEYSDLPY